MFPLLISYGVQTDRTLIQLQLLSGERNRSESQWIENAFQRSESILDWTRVVSSNEMQSMRRASSDEFDTRIPTNPFNYWTDLRRQLLRCLLNCWLITDFIILNTLRTLFSPAFEFTTVPAVAIACSPVFSIAVYCYPLPSVVINCIKRDRYSPHKQTKPINRELWLASAQPLPHRPFRLTSFFSPQSSAKNRAAKPLTKNLLFLVLFCFEIIFKKWNNKKILEFTQNCEKCCDQWSEQTKREKYSKFSTFSQTFFLSEFIVSNK